ncbi:hypothetical protein G9A89_011877 [Geosiphon pyriformis]|nr:hypothetical protein G9A89_011877 [Geosiphon pyriformis]
MYNHAISTGISEVKLSEIQNGLDNTEETDEFDLFEDHESVFSLPRGHFPQAYLDTSNTEITSMDQHLPPSNMGYKLLMKMGWQAGQGLGRLQQGRRDPIRIETKSDSLGVGKQEEENYYHLTSTSKRKALDSEKIAEETETERRNRQTKVQKQETIKKELEIINAAFYCSLCDKQYSKISEYETHLSSYDHNHRKRFKDMKEISRSTKVDKKREKERKREEKELARIQQAALQKAEKNNINIVGRNQVDVSHKQVDNKSSEDAMNRQKSASGSKTWSTMSSEPPSKISNNASQGGWNSYLPNSIPSQSLNKQISVNKNWGGWNSNEASVPHAVNGELGLKGPFNVALGNVGSPTSHITSKGKTDNWSTIKSVSTSLSEVHHNKDSSDAWRSAGLNTPIQAQSQIIIPTGSVLPRKKTDSASRSGNARVEKSANPGQSALKFGFNRK